MYVFRIPNRMPLSMCAILGLSLKLSLKIRQVGCIRRHEAIKRLISSISCFMIFALNCTTIMEASFE